MKDEGRGTRDEQAFSSIVLVSKANGHPSSIVTVLLALMIILSSCGYHFSGTGSLVPAGVRTVAIPVFFNGTNEPFVDVEITQAVVEEFLTDGRLKVTGVEEADLALRGKIVKYEVVALSYNPQSFVQQYRVRLVVEATLEDLRTKKVVWQEKGIESNFISDYAISYNSLGQANITATKIAKDEAIKKAAQDIAWTLRSRVLEGF